MGMESVSEKTARLNHLTCLSARKYSIQFRRRENFETDSHNFNQHFENVSGLNIHFAVSNVVTELIDTEL